jgi:hypothetical protein
MNSPLDNPGAFKMQQFLESFRAPEAAAARQPLAAQAAQPAQPAPATSPAPGGMSAAATDATGAGITGAAGAFRGILEALARSQAIQNQVENDAKDRGSMSRIVDGKIQTSSHDFDSKQRTNGLQSLIEMMRQAQDQRAAGTALQQNATSGMTDAMLRRGK